MNRETEILLRQARALPEDQRRELVQGILRSLFEPGQASEVREAVRRYDPQRGAVEPTSPPVDSKPKRSWSSMATFRAQLGLSVLASNPVLDMREEERF